MVSKLLRRSGVAALEVLEDRLGWVPTVVIEVGVGNYHQEIDVMREAWGQDFELIGFEPHPDIVRNIQSNYPGRLIQLAVGDEDKTTMLHYRKRHQDGANVFGFREEKKETKNCYVEMARLDSVFSHRSFESDNVLLWLDCEGSELKVLQGAEQMIGQVEAVNVEMTAKPRCDGWADIVETHFWLTDHGFWKQWMHTQRNCIGQNDVIYVRRHLFRPEYCCCPYEIRRYRERTNEISSL